MAGKDRMEPRAGEALYSVRAPHALPVPAFRGHPRNAGSVPSMHPRPDPPAAPAPAPPDRLPLDRWPRWVLLCGFWAVPAFFEIFQYYLTLSEQGNPTWLHAALRASVRWGLWALFTPAVLALARRMPLRKGLARVLGFHVAAGAAVTGAQLVLLAVIFEFTFYTAYGDRGWSLGYTIYRVLLNSFGISLTAYWFIVAAYYAVDYYREAREREVAAVRLEASLSQARLEALRMQLNPHFLFNTLHVIATLSAEGRNGATTRMLVLLSDLLRLTLRPSGQFVPLADELDQGGRYLAIEKVRFEDRLQVRRSIDPDLLDAEVPSFLLQPILENAIHHGIAAVPGPGAVSITGRRRGGRLVLRVWNTGEPPPAGGSPAGTGIGLANTRARLEGLYGTDFRLELSPARRGGAVATVELPFRRVAGAPPPAPAAEERHGAAPPAYAAAHE
ncbi:MAG TPA: histidine kinase [Longimicrobium sp.]|nr:histidine kinase [Longimicrobium sp.]